MHENEINDVTQTDAIGKIAGDACKQQHARAQYAIVISRRANEVDKYGDGGGDCESDKEPATKSTAFLHLAKGDARVLGVDEIKKAADDGAIDPGTERPDRPGLA